MNAEQIEDRANKALGYLTDTDELAANLKHEAEKAEHRYAATVDSVFITLDEGSVELRKAVSRGEAEPIYLEYLTAQREYDAVANKRRSEALVVEWCRSLYANYRQGK